MFNKPNLFLVLQSYIFFGYSALYSFKVNSFHGLGLKKNLISTTLYRSISAWMSNRSFKFNRSETEILIVSLNFHLPHHFLLSFSYRENGNSAFLGPMTKNLKSHFSFFLYSIFNISENLFTHFSEYL